MNNFIKQVIEEKFASKAQQRFFYAKANEKGSSKNEKKKWGKWAKEFSDKTNYDKIPDKVENEEEVDEIVDAQGNIAREKIPTNVNTKGTTSDSTSDEVMKTAKGQTGSFGMMGTSYRKYWGEGEEITKEKLLEVALDGQLGAEDTILQNKSYEDAKNHMEDDLGLDDEEAEDRLETMGYDPNLPDDKVRLVENPKKFMEEYIESVLKQRGKDNDILSKEEEIEEVEINPIVQKQIKSLKNSMKTYGLKPDHILRGLKDDE